MAAAHDLQLYALQYTCQQLALNRLMGEALIPSQCSLLPAPTYTWEDAEIRTTVVGLYRDMRMIFPRRQAIPGLLRKLPREIRDLIYGLVLGDTTVDITTSLLAETSTLSNGSPFASCSEAFFPWC
jgi:hypothetical protein